VPGTGNRISPEPLLYKVDNVIPALQKRKLGFREVKQCDQGHSWNATQPSYKLRPEPGCSRAIGTVH
jgi:hypothetical protein